jgi:hypothetical protein
MSLPEQPLVFYTTEQHFRSLTEEIAATGAGDRVALATMALNVEDPAVETLLDALCAASQRRAETSLSIDAFSLMYDNDDRPTGPLAPLRNPNDDTPQCFQRRHAVLGYMREQRVRIGFTNTPRSRLHLPFAGRSHIKGSVVNDRWRIGGCNLDSGTNADMMVGGEQPRAADFLYNTFSAFARSGQVQDILGKEDVIFPIDATTDLLIDVGKRGQSLIYDQALEVIDSTEQQLILTCQHFPGGKTGRHIAALMRGSIEAHTFYNGHHGKLGSTAMGFLRQWDKLTLPQALFAGELSADHPFLHAKIAVNEQEFIVGSHNLIPIGVQLGTAEIALHCRRPDTARQAARVALSCIDQNKVGVRLPAPVAAAG